MKYLTADEARAKSAKREGLAEMFEEILQKLKRQLLLEHIKLSIHPRSK